MDPDNFQQAWQAETSRTRVTVYADLLRTEVERSQQGFQSTIFWRDIREVGVSLVMIPIWLVMGMTMSLPWTWYLTVPALVFVAGFILADRKRHPKRPSEPGEPLLFYVKESLGQVEHQIWLLRNIFWWYLLPFCISLMAFFLQIAWNRSSDWWEFVFSAGTQGLFLLVVYGGVYFLNQYAVRKQLEPRRQDLLRLIASLEGDASDENAGDIMELASSLAKPTSSCGLYANWTEDWNLMVPSWRVAAMIVLPTLLGALGGLYSGLKLQIHDMGPTLFQTVTGAVIPFEIALGIVWWRFWKRKQAALADQSAITAASGGGSDSSAKGKSRLLPRAPAMLIIFLIVFLTVMAVVSLYSFVSHDSAAQRQLISNYAGAPRSSGPAGDWLAKLIVDQRKEKHLVGLAAMVTVDGNVEAAAAYGERKVGSGASVEAGDRWHLGGISKSVTATMLARLVEAGKMKWTDTVGAAFPEDSVHEDWKSVTLQQLLTDTAGAPANFSLGVRRQHPALGPECTEARREAVADVLAEEPAYPPGKEYLYSSVGYTIAAAMAEQATGARWEELVKQEVFEPLCLADSGFGPPKSGDETLEQPRGHRVRLGGKAAAEDTEDNTSIIGPAATIHMSLPDLCTYAAEHLRGDLGEGKLLSAETYQLLHDRDFGPYSSGWIRRLEGDEDRRYAMYWHNGSNTMWYAFVTFIPEKKMVVAIASNDGDLDQAEAAAWEIVEASVKEFGATRGVPIQGMD
jgi:CubicO group peptidase (beta-lactamase class C family)